MSTQGNSANLAQAARVLNLEWEKTKAQWRDARSLDFEDKYLAELPGQIAAAINAIEDMEALSKKVRSDCE
jgi:hypothetical protein